MRMTTQTMDTRREFAQQYAANVRSRRPTCEADICDCANCFQVRMLEAVQRVTTNWRCDVGQEYVIDESAKHKYLADRQAKMASYDRLLALRGDQK